MNDRNGSQDEWKAFAERHAAFLERFDALKVAADAAFKNAPVLRPEAPFVIYGLVRQAAQDFLEILLLSANGYGLASYKILRGMFERVVTARWIHLHPDQARRFLEWEIVQSGKIARAFLDGMGDVLRDDHKAKCEQAVADAKPLRAQFTVDACKTCGTTKLNHSWTTADVVSMARAAGLGDWVGPAYYEPLKYEHATAAGLGKLFQRDGDTMALCGTHREEAHHALQLGHFVLLHGLALLQERADDTVLTAAMKAAVAAYHGAWDVPVENEGERAGASSACT